jgi:hypothetical protein
LSPRATTLFAASPSAFDCLLVLSGIGERGTIQLLADCLFDNTASNCDEIVIFGTLGHDVILLAPDDWPSP